MNVINMFTNKREIDKLKLNGYGSADFNISTTPLMFDTGSDSLSISKKKVIYRTDTGIELGVHGKSYKAVSPKKMIDTTRNILERSDLNLTDITENIATSHDGSRTFVRYNMPSHEYTTPDGDTATLQLLATTSFDSTFPFLISVGALQNACLNTQIFTNGTVCLFKSKHTHGLDIEHGANIISKALDVFESEQELWSKWHKTTVLDWEAFEIFAKAVNWKSAYPHIASWRGDVSLYNHVANEVPMNKNFQYLWKVYKEIYCNKLGNNYWAVYNALTDWSSHAPLGKRQDPKNIASVLNRRQQTVRDVISRADWGIAV
jgi:hypothetical protein